MLQGRGGWLPALASHPLFPFIDRVWDLIGYMITVVHMPVSSLKANEGVLQSYRRAAKQYHNIINDALSKEYALPTAPPNSPAIKLPWRTYEHNIAHRVPAWLEESISTGVSLLDLSSFFVEAQNHAIKVALTNRRRARQRERQEQRLEAGAAVPEHHQPPRCASAHVAAQHIPVQPLPPAKEGTCVPRGGAIYSHEVTAATRRCQSTH